MKVILISTLILLSAPSHAFGLLKLKAGYEAIKESEVVRTGYEKAKTIATYKISVSQSEKAKEYVEKLIEKSENK